MREDAEVSELVRAQLSRPMASVLAGQRAERVRGRRRRTSILIADHAGGEVRIAFDQVLVAVGRVANTAGYGLEELGIGDDAATHGGDRRCLQTLYPNITACGDVAGPLPVHAYGGAPGVVRCGQRAVRRLAPLRGRLSVYPGRPSPIPRSRASASTSRKRGRRAFAYDVRVYGIDDLDRAIADGAAHGFVKVLTGRARTTSSARPSSARTPVN